MTHPSTLPDHAADQLARYKELVERYQGAVDLISKRGLEEFDRYVSEGLRYAALIARLAGPAPCVVDVGSGVGLPGVVIAIALPGADVRLVERRHRRAAFLELVVAQLGLGNAEVVEGDVRDLEGVTADVVTAQAVASQTALVDLTRGVRAEASWLISRRGPGWREELGLPEAAVGAGQDGEADGALQDEAGHAAQAEAELARADIVEEVLEPHGSLVAIRLPGGSACRSSA